MASVRQDLPLQFPVEQSACTAHGGWTSFRCYGCHGNCDARLQTRQSLREGIHAALEETHLLTEGCCKPTIKPGIGILKHDRRMG